MTNPKLSKSDCAGCYNDFYNGKNDIGVSECWSFKDATIVRRVQASIHQQPPYKQKPTKVPRCYSRTGYCFIDPKKLNKEGYIK